MGLQELDTTEQLREHAHVCTWITLLHTWSTVNQLHFDRNILSGKTYPNIQSTIIHNNPKLEITQTSTNRWMGKQAMTSLGRGERSNKMDSTHTGGEVDAYQKYYTECNKPNLKAYSVQDSSLSMEAFQWLPVVGGRGEGTDKGEDFAGKMFYLDCSVILATPYGTVP